MDRVFRLTIELRWVGFKHDALEFVVKEQIRTASPRPICTLQIGEWVSPDDLMLLQQIVDDCSLAAVNRTVGLQEQLTF